MITSTYEQNSTERQKHQLSPLNSTTPDRRSDSEKTNSTNLKKNNVFDTRAPCQVREILTNRKVYDQDSDKMIIVEFPEYVCDEAENQRRKKAGRIPTGFICEQLWAEEILFRDQEHRPIEIKINYRAGCELRCVSDNCER